MVVVVVVVVGKEYSHFVGASDSELRLGQQLPNASALCFILVFLLAQTQ